MGSIWAQIEELDCKYVPSERFKDKVHSYGTAGFRTHSDALDNVWYRVGLVVAVIAWEMEIAGVVITASHNPGEDNGVKIMNRVGSMIEMCWEELLTKVVNSKSLIKDLESVILGRAIKFSNKARVLIAWDTRESSPRLVNALKAGIEVIGIEINLMSYIYEWY